MNLRNDGKVIEVNSANIYTQQLGSRAGLPLLFLHGGIQTLEAFESLIDGLADYNCILIDSRGHGASTLGTEALSYPLLAADVEAVIEAYDLQNPVIIGHSDGGIAGMHVALRKNHALGGLITMSSHADPPEPNVIKNIFSRITAKSWQERFPESVTLYQQINPAPDFDRLFEAVMNMWRNTGGDNYPDTAVSNIECPVMVLGGEADHLVPLTQTIALSEIIPGARLGVLPFGGHAFYEEYPDSVIAFIRKFLDEVKTSN